MIVCSCGFIVAYVPNLRGDDVSNNPVLVSYLHIDLDHAILFVEQGMVDVPCVSISRISESSSNGI
jgi:Creatinase/Prolidase N-terminal domain